MRLTVLESIAPRSIESEVTGRLWGGSFRAQPLLDEVALAACMAYVNLNPIRAGIAEAPETSGFTSMTERIGVTWMAVNRVAVLNRFAQVVFVCVSISGTIACVMYWRRVPLDTPANAVRWCIEVPADEFKIFMSRCVVVMNSGDGVISLEGNELRDREDVMQSVLACAERRRVKAILLMDDDKRANTVLERLKSVASAGNVDLFVETASGNEAGSDGGRVIFQVVARSTAQSKE